MMTFVTSDNVVECARSLDRSRLGKQRVEAYQILRTLKGLSLGWKNHPAVKMWKGYEEALAVYMNAMIDEWIARGYKNTMQKEIVHGAPSFPWWFYWTPLHNSHKASLNRKMPEYYKFDVSERFMTHGYIWPHMVPRNRKFHICEICECILFQSSM